MLNKVTYDRAVRAIADIETVGVRTGITNARVVQISGPTAGRESDPTYFWGYVVRYTSPTAGECIKFWPGGEVRDVLRNVYVVDGMPYYVAGWQGGDAARFGGDLAEDGYVVLHPYTADQCFMPRRCVFLRSAASVTA